MQSEDVYKTGIRKNLNNLLKNLTDDEKIDKESVSFRNLELELVKKEKESTEWLCEILFETTKRSGCPDRLLLLELFDMFFLRYSLFRNHILNDPQDFLDLMVETNPIHSPLPGSKKSGKELKANAIRVIKGWERQFMKSDARMKCIVVTLKKTKFVNYDTIGEECEKERLRKEKMDQRKKMMLQSTVAAYRNKFEQIKSVTDKLVIELETTLEILVPSFTKITEMDTPGTSGHVPTSTNQNFEILIPSLAPEIEVSSENDAVVEAFLDAKLLLVHRIQTLRRLAKRLQVLKKPGEQLSQLIINYRDSLKVMVFKAEELKLKGYIRNARKPREKKRFDEDFIDVELSIDDILMVQYSKQAEEAVEKITEQSSKKDLEKTTKTDKKLKVKSVEFGLDLKYWGEEREQVQVPKNNADCHRFWRSADEGTSSGTAQQNIYTQRQFTFVGEAPKSNKVCRARLPNGSLCPRRDFNSCPLHGKIVTRDEKGDPITEDDRRADILRDELRKRKETEIFAREIEKQHGKKKKKKKHDEETTYSQEARNRLQKKLLDPKTVARVSAVLDSSRKNRIEKAFGQQFSHL